MADRHTILVVEDNDDFFTALEAALGDRYEVLRSASCSSAIAAIHDGADRLDAIVLDMWLPREDGGKAIRNSGLEVLLMVKGRPTHPGTAPEVQVVVVTGHQDLQNAIESQRLGSFRYLVKGSARMFKDLEKDIEAACAETKGRRIHKAIMEGGRMDSLQPLPLRGAAPERAVADVADGARSAAAVPTVPQTLADVLRQIRQLADEALRSLDPEQAAMPVGRDI